MTSFEMFFHMKKWIYADMYLAKSERGLMMSGDVGRSKHQKIFTKIHVFSGSGNRDNVQGW